MTKGEGPAKVMVTRIEGDKVTVFFGNQVLNLVADSNNTTMQNHCMGCAAGVKAWVPLAGQLNCVAGELPNGDIAFVPVPAEAIREFLGQNQNQEYDA